MSNRMTISDLKVRVRFAPSPTGPLHVGGVRTALYNYLFAKRFGGDFILRVEDTDPRREVDGAIKYITDSFEWLGIMPDEGYGIGGEHGPYIQSERKDIYKKHIEMLVESGHAYYAFDTSEELEKMRKDLEASGFGNAGYAGSVRDRMKNSLVLSAENVKNRLEAGDPYVIRFNMPRNEEVKFKDEVRGWVTFNTKTLDDKVIWKSSDGMPTYHLANVVDDHLMEISHVIRGEEWISSTPLHVLLYKAFGWDSPVYAHLPLILAPNKKKLGKRDGDMYGIPIFPISWDYVNSDKEEVSITGFREVGYEPDALLNFVALLGWNPGDNREYMTLKEMSELFSVERINKAGAMFDMKKLNAFNSHYLTTRNTNWILDRMDILPFGNGHSKDQLDMLANMAAERVTFASELNGSLEYLFVRPSIDYDFKVKNLDEFEKVMNVFITKVDEIDWSSDGIRNEIYSISEGLELKMGKVMPLLRVAISGGEPGPQLPDVIYLIGKDETRVRIKSLLGKLKEIV